MNSAQPSGKRKTPRLSSSPSALYIPLIPSLSFSSNRRSSKYAIATLLLRAPCPLSSPLHRCPYGDASHKAATEDAIPPLTLSPLAPPRQAGASPPAVKRFGKPWVTSVHEYPASPENPTCRVAKKRWGERAESCAGRTGARGWRH